MKIQRFEVKRKQIVFEALRPVPCSVLIDIPNLSYSFVYSASNFDGYMRRIEFQKGLQMGR